MRWSIVKRLVSRTAPATILEIGAGQGSFGARLARRATYLGVEPDPTSFAIARSRIEPIGGQVRNESYQTLPDVTYDLVCSFEVLEHLEDDVSALQDWHRFVAPGGHVLVSMPAWQERYNAWDEMVGHYRRYSPDQARSALADAGFVDAQVIVYGWPLGYWTENVRGRIAAKRGVASEDGGTSMDDRTAASGRVLQPKRVAGLAVHAATQPFVALQRLQPTRGTGVVVLARRR